MRKLKRLTLGALLAFLLVSCQSYKKVPYLQDTAFVNDTEQSVRQTGVKVMPKDLLTIAVSCSTPELAAPFNLVNVILLVFILLYTNKIAVIAPCKRNRIETKSVF